MAAGKTEDELRRELALLEEQQKEVDQRLKEHRSILGRGRGIGANRGRGGAFLGGRGVRPHPVGGLGRTLKDPPSLDFARRPVLREPTEEAVSRKRLSSAVVLEEAANQDANSEPVSKRRLLSSVVARGNGDESARVVDSRVEPDQSAGGGDAEPGEMRGEAQQLRSGPRRSFLARDGVGPSRYDPPEEPEAAPRVVPELKAPEIKRSRRLFGALLGTLAQFRKDDEKAKNSDAHMKRLTSLQRADERSRELREKARQSEVEAAQAKRDKDLVLRNRLAAKMDEKQLELLFLKWTAHQKELTGFLRTNAEPHIFYVPAKHNETTEKLFESRDQHFEEWKASRRAELTEYEKQLQEEALRVPESARWNGGKSNGHANVPGPLPMETDIEERGNPHNDAAKSDGVVKETEVTEGNNNGREAPRTKSKSERLSRIQDSDEEEGYDPNDLDKLLVGGEKSDDEL